MASPESTESAPNVGPSRNTTVGYADLERKRARDRKSQQAMRDRNKWTIQNLSHQVDYLSRSLESSVTRAHQLELRIQTLEQENAELVSQSSSSTAVIHHKVSDVNGEQQQQPSYPHMLLTTQGFHQWQLPPNNTPPSCLADEIIQSFVSSERQARRSACSADTPEVKTPASKPEFSSLVDDETQQQSEDGISNIVGGIVRSYTEIESLPNKVGVFYMMASLIKWLILLDEESWNMLPAWLRPSMLQLEVQHASWIDRIPWPRARDYLVQHPEISLDDFAASYSSCLSIRWEYDPSHVLIPMGTVQVVANPIYEEHIRHLKNWTVGDSFRARFPVLACLIDDDTKTVMYSSG